MAAKFTQVENQVNSWIKEVKDKKPQPIYFLYGDNDFYIDQICDAIEKSILTESEKSFNQSVLYGKDVDIFEVLSTAARYPMMAEFQVVIVKEAQQMGGLQGEQGKNRLIKYAENPNKQTVLVFLYKNKKLNGNSKLAKTLKKQTVYFESPNLLDWEVDQWILSRVKAKGYTIGPMEAKMIAENVGNEMTRLYNEIEKMTLANSQTKVISAEIVEKYIGSSKSYTVFELQNAILGGNFNQCIKIANYYCTNPKDFALQAFTGSLYRMLGQLLVTVKYKNESAQAIAARIKMNPFIVNKIYLPARRFYSVGHVLRGFQQLAKLDRDSKGIEGTSQTDGQKLKSFLIHFMHNS